MSDTHWLNEDDLERLHKDGFWPENFAMNALLEAGVKVEEPLLSAVTTAIHDYYLVNAKYEEPA